jgi:hypothetical protein
MDDPILIDCEGTCCPPAAVTAGDGIVGLGICSMCGGGVTLVDGVVLAHQRDDILARLKRGDFDGSTGGQE